MGQAPLCFRVHWTTISRVKNTKKLHNNFQERRFLPQRLTTAGASITPPQGYPASTGFYRTSFLSIRTRGLGTTLFAETLRTMLSKRGAIPNQEGLVEKIAPFQKPLDVVTHLLPFFSFRTLLVCLTSSTFGCAIHTILSLPLIQSKSGDKKQ